MAQVPPDPAAERTQGRRSWPIGAGMVAVVLLTGAFLAGLWLGGNGVGGNRVGNVVADGADCVASETFEPLCDAYARIRSDYVDEISEQELIHGAVDGMVEALPDPYSGYLPPRQYESAIANLSGEFSGIGAEVGIENLESPEDTDECTAITATCAMVVVAPLDGSPAAEAGLRSGDVILAVDGEPTTGSTLQEQVLKVRGEEGTEVTLTVRTDGEERDITITRGVIELDAVETRQLADDIGYIRLASFSSDAVEEFHAGLDSLLEKGARAVVLDLRDNPGGYINAAQEIASEFLPQGTLIFTQESGEEVVEWRVEDAGLLSDGEVPLAVLVNEGSASASEIVAAALKEHERGTLVGESTFGKNTVQSWTELPDGGGLKLTTHRWFSPGHGSVEGSGIEPDVVVEALDETPVGTDDPDDPILDRAVEILTER